MLNLKRKEFHHQGNHNFLEVLEPLIELIQEVLRHQLDQLCLGILQDMVHQLA